MLTPGQEEYCTVLGTEREVRKTLQVAYMTTVTSPTGATSNKLCKYEFSKPTFTIPSAKICKPLARGAISLSLTLCSSPDSMFANHKQTIL